MYKAGTNMHALTLAGQTTLAGAMVSTGGGLWTWLGTHNQEIGAICAIVGASCALGGFVVSIWREFR